MSVLALHQQFSSEAESLLFWMEDPEVTDILINGTTSLFVESRGVLVEKPNPFFDRQSIFNFIERLLLPLGRRLDATRPFSDGELADRSRFHIIFPPLVLNAPHVSIRKHRRCGEATLDSFGPTKILNAVSQAVADRKNVLICGPTGSGKTTLLSRLIDRVPAAERVCVVEEVREIHSPHPHFVSLAARPPTPEGVGEVTLRMLVKNLLRMRPDRLVLGECRGEEAFDVLQALHTGHCGSMATIHAKNGLDALKRLETLVTLGCGVPIRSIREWVASSIDVVIALRQRKIVEVIWLEGLEGDVYRIVPVILSSTPEESSSGRR